MSLTQIVSYDGTAGDRDALSLARIFAGLGASTILAYVAHTHGDHTEAQAMLDAGAADLEGARTAVVVNASTSEGLKALASAEGAGLIVFGSEYRTPVNRVAFQKSAAQLLDGGSTAIAIAPAGHVARSVENIGLVAELDDHAAIDTAHQIGTHFGSTVTDGLSGADLLIFGSRAAAGEGRVLLSSRNEITIEEEAKSPVLVLARGVALDFASALYMA